MKSTLARLILTALTLAFAGCQSLVRVSTVADFAAELLALAGAASTVLAAIGQADAGANGRGQNGFSALSGKSTSAGLDGNFKRSVGNLGHDVLVILEGVSGSLFVSAAAVAATPVAP